MSSPYTSKTLRVKESPTLAASELSKKLEGLGKRVVRFDCGDILLETPEGIREAAHEGLKKGYTHYTSCRGLPELRSAIAEHLEDWDIEADPESEIVVTPGSKFAVYAAMKSTIDPGDEVILLSPSWPSYENCVTLVNGKPIFVELNRDFHVDEEALRAATSAKTKMIVVNTPNNPSGSVFNSADLRIIRDIAIDHDLLVISDEIYKSLVYDGLDHLSFKSEPDTHERTILVDGFSKAYAMTGWRLGYAVAPPEIAETMVKVIGNTVTCPSAFVQYAGIAALKDERHSAEIRQRCDERRRLALRLLDDLDGITYRRPRATFYVFPDISSYGLGSVEFSRGLLERSGVSVVPGVAFGSAWDGCVRIAYAIPKKDISLGFRRIRSFLESLGS